MKRIGYSLLGEHGALGNQLWEIAGTFGVAASREAMPLFPTDWFYRPYFSVPDSFFGDNFSVCEEDLAGDYLQDIAHWAPMAVAVYNIFMMSDRAEEMIERTYGLDGADLLGKTCVHVRRGNNATPQYASHHPVPSLDYYEQAMDMTGGPFRVVTDSPEWCKKQSLFKDCEFGVGPPPGVDIMELTKYGPLDNDHAVMDLNSMRYARKVVMSNSSFSWWGSFLRGPETSPEDKVIYPLKWYGEPLAHIDTSVMFNRSWAADWVGI